MRAPMPPSYMFVIDVSVTAISCGMLTAVVDGIKASLDALSAHERTMVAFLTFDPSRHFYNLKAGLAQPQMLVRSRRHACSLWQAVVPPVLCLPGCSTGAALEAAAVSPLSSQASRHVMEASADGHMTACVACRRWQRLWSHLCRSQMT